MVILECWGLICGLIRRGDPLQVVPEELCSVEDEILSSSLSYITHTCKASIPPISHISSSDSFPFTISLVYCKEHKKYIEQQSDGRAA